jgi:hypothetical protein
MSNDDDIKGIEGIYPIDDEDFATEDEFYAAIPEPPDRRSDRQQASEARSMRRHLRAHRHSPDLPNPIFFCGNEDCNMMGSKSWAHYWPFRVPCIACDHSPCDFMECDMAKYRPSRRGQVYRGQPLPIHYCSLCCRDHDEQRHMFRVHRRHIPARTFASRY